MGAGRDRVLITGGSGFVGACLARNLIDEGHDVHLVLRAESKTWRLTGLDGRYTPHQADLRDAAALRNAITACRPEVVYHLAAHGAYNSQTDRATIISTNLLGTVNLLEALEGNDHRMLVNVGSSSEYGHKLGPIIESDRLEPRTDYGVAKAASTMLVQAEAFKGRPVTTVRIFSAYGCWDDPSRLATYVMGCCLRGESPRLTSGTQPRDYIYVNDIVSLLKIAANTPQTSGRILHAASGRQCTVREMVETILSVCGDGQLTAQFGAQALRPDEPQTWVANIEQTTALTGWTPRYDLRAGVEDMWRWFSRQGTSSAA